MYTTLESSALLSYSLKNSFALFLSLLFSETTPRLKNDSGTSGIPFNICSASSNSPSWIKIDASVFWQSGTLYPYRFAFSATSPQYYIISKRFGIDLNGLRCRNFTHR